MNRFAKSRRDLNDDELVELSRDLGSWMIQLNTPADYLRGYRGEWSIVEIKNPSGRDELTPAQIKFQKEAYYRQLPILYWRTAEDVYRDHGARVAA